MNPFVVPAALTAAQTVTKNVSDVAISSKSFISTVKETLDLFGKLSESTMNVSASLQDVAVDVMEKEGDYDCQLYTIKYVLVISRSYLLGMGKEKGIIHLVINKKMRILDENSQLSVPLPTPPTTLGAATTTNSNNVANSPILPSVFGDYPDMDNIVKEFDKRVLMQYDPADLEEISLMVKNVADMIRDAFSCRDLNNGFNHFYVNALNTYGGDDNDMDQDDEDDEEQTACCYSCFCGGHKKSETKNKKVFKGTFAKTKNGKIKKNRGFIKSSYFVPRVTIIIGDMPEIDINSRRKDNRFRLYNNIKKQAEWQILFATQKQIITNQGDLLKSIDDMKFKMEYLDQQQQSELKTQLAKTSQEYVLQLLLQSKQQSDILRQYQDELKDSIPKKNQDGANISLALYEKISSTLAKQEKPNFNAFTELLLCVDEATSHQQQETQYHTSRIKELEHQVLYLKSQVLIQKKLLLNKKEEKKQQQIQQELDKKLDDLVQYILSIKENNLKLSDQSVEKVNHLRNEIKTRLNSNTNSIDSHSSSSDQNNNVGNTNDNEKINITIISPLALTAVNREPFN